MLPSMIQHDLGDIALRLLKLTRQNRLTFTRRAANANRKHIGLCNSGVTVLRSAWSLACAVASFLYAVFHVISLSAFKQMLRVKAPGVVAPMETIKAGRKRMTPCFKGGSMNIRLFAVYSNLSVAARTSASAGPVPAASGVYDTASQQSRLDLIGRHALSPVLGCLAQDAQDQHRLGLHRPIHQAAAQWLYCERLLVDEVSSRSCSKSSWSSKRYSCSNYTTCAGISKAEVRHPIY
jgi:hypothetical protein